MTCTPVRLNSTENVSFIIFNHLKNGKGKMPKLVKCKRAQFKPIKELFVMYAIQSKQMSLKNKLVKLSELQKVYTESLDKSEHSNPRYRNENLKAKLIKKYKNQIMFCEMGSSGKYQSSIVFNSSLYIKTAVMQVYVFDSSDAIKDVSNLMHSKIAEFMRNYLI